MKIIVPVKLVPDLVEELSIDASGTMLDTTWLRMMLNEFDDHALEEALLLAERAKSDGIAAEVTVIAPDLEGVDDVLFTAAAKGAGRLMKITRDIEGDLNNHALARALSALIQEIQPDLVLTGVQAHNDLDGPLGPQLAAHLDIPYMGYIASVQVEGGKAIVHKEYPGGLIAEMSTSMPAVLGIQAAESPPRYVAFSKIRQAMNTAEIEEREIEDLDASGGPVISRLFQPEMGEGADMITGDPDQVADKIVQILYGIGLV